MESIIVPGQLKLRTIRGRHGPFNVGLLACALGEFVVKDPEFEQYKEGKYDGEFAIGRIFAKSFVSLGGVRVEIRASLNGMPLSGIDKLGREDARTMGGAVPLFTRTSPCPPQRCIASMDARAS